MASNGSDVFVPAPPPSLPASKPKDPNWQLGVYFGIGAAAAFLTQPLLLVASLLGLMETALGFLSTVGALLVAGYALGAFTLRPRHGPTMFLGAGMVLLGALVGGIVFVLFAFAAG